MNAKSILTVVAVFAVLVLGVFYRYYNTGVDSRGATRLMQAIEKNDDLKTTVRLIEKSKDLNVQDKQGRTALFYAAWHAQDPAVVKDLLVGGSNMHVADTAGQTAVMAAAQFNPSAEVLAEFLKNGAHVNATDNQGNTALILAAQGNTAPVIKQLLRYRADPEMKNNAGKTASDVLAENPQLTDQEKTDYRQAMLVLSILQGSR